MKRHAAAVSTRSPAGEDCSEGRALGSRACLRIVLVALIASAVLESTAVRAASFDTFGDGFWRIVCQATSKGLVATGSGASQASTPSTPAAAAQQQFEVLYNLESDTYRLRNRDSWLCLGAKSGATTNGTPVVELSTYTGAASQRWKLVSVGNGYYRIANAAATGMVLETDNAASTPSVTLAPSAANTAQYWQFVYQTHYPKKGTAGYDGDWARFGASWSYNWGRDSGAALPSSVVFEPMQWGQWWPDFNTLSQSYAAWHSTPKPLYILGFNEPDHTDQANMSAATAIGLWPQLQAMNVPLVSPAAANAFGGWLADFYTQIASKGYRVDYTSVHRYANPDASGLISHLQSVYNTWGRPIWLTEFSAVDWGGTATWTEEDNYRFLAEFLWRAEDLVWLKRYAIFSFSGAPSTNPWDRNGHRSDVFLQDGSTFTPFGELYAAWDANRTPVAQTPYLIQNRATSFRLCDIPSASGPVPGSIRRNDASAQWILLPGSTSGKWYIQSLRDGRRMRCTGTLLDLASPGMVGTNVEWTFNGPDSSGYYFIDNPANKRTLRMDRSNNGAGVPTALSFTVEESGTPSDNNRWRFVKLPSPVSLASSAKPTALTAVAADQRVTLHWSGTASRYNVYRLDGSGAEPVLVAPNIAGSVFNDTTVTNDTAYRYTVAGVNGLSEESAHSDEASCTPSTNAAPRGIVAEYKFENNFQDSSGSEFHATSVGGVGFVPGRVDGTAAAFNGVDGCLEIPNSVANDFTIACWIKTTSQGGTGKWWSGMGIVDGDVSGTTNDFGLALVGTKAGFGAGNPDITITSSRALNDGQWHHVAATRTVASGSLKLYVDGVLQTATSTGPVEPRSAPQTLRIGGIRSNVGFLNGALDELRIFDYALGGEEVARLAQAASTMVARYTFDNNTRDTSGFSQHGTAANMTFISGRNNDRMAAQFNGVSSFLDVPASIATDFSVSLWIKTAAASAGTGQWWNGKGILDGEVSGAAEDFGLTLLGGKAAFGIGNPDTTILSKTTINNGLWHHVVATRNNTTGAIRLYVDGSLHATATAAVGPRSAPDSLRLGGLHSGSGFLNGAVADVRLFNYVLNAGQVSALFAPATLPSPWEEDDIGAVGSEGYAIYNVAASTWSVGGGGADIASASDRFHFLNQTVTGPCTLAARIVTGAVNSDGSTNANAKAGIMLRGSTAPDAPFVGLFHTQGQGLQLLYRDTTGASVAQQSTNIPLSVVSPAWLRLVRDGRRVTASYALSASVPAVSNWVAIATHSITLPTSGLAGLAVCSRDASDLATATFSGVSVITPAGSWRQVWFGSPDASGDAADGADPDGDGVINLFERAFGLDPSTADRFGLPKGRLDGDTFIMEYRRAAAATDLAFVPEWTQDLVQWSSDGVLDSVISTDGTTETRDAAVQRIGRGALFMRLRLMPP